MQLTHPLETIAAISTLVVVAVAGLQFVGPYIYQYRFRPEHFEVRLFGLMPILIPRFPNISEARVLSGLELFNPWAGLRFPNRVLTRLSYEALKGLIS